MPRIDDAAVILLTCEAKKGELNNLIATDFSNWTTCINDKSALLSGMFDSMAELGEEFMPFLTRIRDQYDTLKEDNMVLIVDPELDIPSILD
jgi:hypothetical protein